MHEAHTIKVHTHSCPLRISETLLRTTSSQLVEVKIPTVQSFTSIQSSRELIHQNQERKTLRKRADPVFAVNSTAHRWNKEEEQLSAVLAGSG